MNEVGAKEYWARYSASMKKLLIAKDYELTQERGVIYFEDLHVYPIELIEIVFERARKEIKFFPQISEIIKFIEEEKERASERSMQIPYIKEERVPIEKQKAAIKLIYERIPDVQKIGNGAAIRPTIEDLETMKKREAQREFLKKQAQRLIGKEVAGGDIKKK